MTSQRENIAFLIAVTNRVLGSLSFLDKQEKNIIYIPGRNYWYTHTFVFCGRTIREFLQNSFLETTSTVLLGIDLYFITSNLEDFIFLTIWTSSSPGAAGYFSPKANFFLQLVRMCKTSYRNVWSLNVWLALKPFITRWKSQVWNMYKILGSTLELLVLVLLVFYLCSLDDFYWY